MQTGLGNFPSINELLESPPLKSLVDRVNPSRVMTSVRTFVDGMRQELQTAVTQRQIPSPIVLAEQIAQWIMRQEQLGVRSVLNATGIVLHPEFGGAPLADEALTAMRAVAGSYSRLPGNSIVRSPHAEQLLQRLIGSETALVTANPPLAIALVTNALACGRDVIVPRRQMTTNLEGSRAYELIAAAGGRLREIGSANELSLSDLDDADDAAFLFWQQGLSFELTGHQQSVDLMQVCTWANRRSLPVIVDLGIGGIHDCASFGIAVQPTAIAAIQAGASAVIIRGDGLLGGPPGGIIAGKNSLLQKLTSHPLCRAASCDRATLAAVEATLELYQSAAEQQSTSVERAIPLLGLLATSPENLKHRSERLAPQLAASPALAVVEPRADFAYLTSARLDSQKFSTWGLALQPAQGTAADLLAALSNTSPAVVGSLAGEGVWLDLRAISPREDQQLVQAINQLPAPR